MTTCLEKSCSFGLLRVPFLNCCQFMYLVISLLVLRAGYGISLYQFLIIAYLFTLQMSLSIIYYLLRNVIRSFVAATNLYVKGKQCSNNVVFPVTCCDKTSNMGILSQMIRISSQQVFFQLQDIRCLNGVSNVLMQYE